MSERRSRRASPRRLQRADDGAVAVEFALILPVLVMLMFGVITTGLSYSDHLSVTNAVREGGRLGAAIPYSSNPTSWANSVRSRVQQVYMNGTNTLTDSQVCVQLATASGPVSGASPSPAGSCGTAPSTPSGLGAGDCVVKVWVLKPAKITLLVFPDLTFDIGAESVSRYGRTDGICTSS